MLTLAARYRDILTAHVAAPGERHLAEAADIGASLVSAGIPPEEAVEMHEAALRHVALRMPEMTLEEAARLCSEPLMEIFVAYGLAFRDRMESLERARADAQTSEQFLSTILATAAALVTVLDGSGRIVRFNGACEKAASLPAADAAGRLFWEVFAAPEESDAVRSCFADLVAGNASRELESHCVTAAGTRIVAWSAAVIRRPDGSAGHVIATGLDVTRQRVAESQAQHRERLAEVGQLAATIAHEIGNPLAAMSGATQVARARQKDPDAIRTFDALERHIDRVGGIVRQMLDLARPPRVVRAPTDLNATVQSALAWLHYDKRAVKVAIELSPAPGLPLVSVLEDRLLQVFLNLGTNALDALAEVSSQRPPRLHVTTRYASDPRGKRIVISFEDNGPGIPEAMVDTIFQPFVTTKGRASGTGLGLAVSAEIVREHRGEIRIENRPGEGATFHVEIPV
ncbi:MAG: ATP-binding protein [Acidobacteriota bacterium]